ncbi:hypothetical protein J6590_071749 [Homalodisca vitripennis]|nr:hypothetical protein J6590_071749 [Homalodisca vitripennis]
MCITILLPHSFGGNFRVLVEKTVSSADYSSFYRGPAVTPVRYAPITSRLSTPVVAASPCGSLHTASFPRRRYAILNLPYRRYRLVWWRCERVVLVTLFLLSRNWIVDVNNYYVIVRRQSNFTTAPQQLMARSILECTASAAVSCTGFLILHFSRRNGTLFISLNRDSDTSPPILSLTLVIY